MTAQDTFKKILKHLIYNPKKICYNTRVKKIKTLLKELAFTSADTWETFSAAIAFVQNLMKGNNQ